MLGTSDSSIDFAIQNKMHFSLSLFHSLQTISPSPSIILDFTEKFFKENGYEPQVNIAVSVFCNEDKNRVEDELRNRKNVVVNIAGNIEECRYKIREMADTYHVNEIIVLNLGNSNTEKEYLIENLLDLSCN